MQHLLLPNILFEPRLHPVVDTKYIFVYLRVCHIIPCLLPKCSIHPLIMTTLPYIFLPPPQDYLHHTLLFHQRNGWALLHEIVIYHGRILLLVHICATRLYQNKLGYVIGASSNPQNRCALVAVAYYCRSCKPIHIHCISASQKTHAQYFWSLVQSPDCSSSEII